MPENRQRTGNKGSFCKGKSGNPGGRPKLKQEERDALEMIRSLAPEAAETLHGIIRSPDAPAAAKIRAAEIILDRTYGKPEAKLNVLSVDYTALDEAFEALEAK